MFVGVAIDKANELCRALGEIEIVLAPATIFGAGLEPGSPWNINTAEI
jgi:hypothetical protein